MCGLFVASEWMSLHQTSSTDHRRRAMDRTANLVSHVTRQRELKKLLRQALDKGDDVLLLGNG